MIDKRVIAFAEVARSLSFTEAAHRLHLSVSAISKHVTHLERELDTKLILRNTRSLRLTPEGALFLKDVLHITDLADSAQHRMRCLHAEPSGTVKVLLPGPFGADFVLQHLPALMDRYPRLEVEIGFSDRSVDLMRTEFDIVVQYGPPADSRLIARRIGRFETVLAASPAYLARHGVPTELNDLPKHSCIRIRTEDKEFEWKLQRRGGGPDAETWHHHPRSGIVISGQYDRALQAAAAGLGITMADVPTAREMFKSGVLNTVLPEYAIAASEPSADVYMVFPHSDHISPRVRVMIDILARCMKQAEEDEFDPSSHGFACQTFSKA